MNRLIVGTVTALYCPDKPKTKPDNRRTLEKTITYDVSTGAFIPSVQVVDGGQTDAGAVTSYNGVEFAAADWDTFKGYCDDWTAVTVVDLRGVSTANCHINLLDFDDSKHFGSVSAIFEVWRV